MSEESEFTHCYLVDGNVVLKPDIPGVVELQ